MLHKNRKKMHSITELSITKITNAFTYTFIFFLHKFINFKNIRKTHIESNKIRMGKIKKKEIKKIYVNLITCIGFFFLNIIIIKYNLYKKYFVLFCSFKNFHNSEFTLLHSIQNFFKIYC